MSLRAGSHVFALLMLFLCVTLHTSGRVRACSCCASYCLVYSLVCHVCEDFIDSGCLL